jgi:N-carbamoylputrescine amidase
MTTSSTESTVKVAALQAPFSTDTKANVTMMMEMTFEAAQLGAQVVLLPELFENIYFCTYEKEQYFELAKPLKDHPTLAEFQKLARSLEVVIPVSFFEREEQSFYNSLAMIDVDGTILGVYRKSHIPDGPGYEEKYYFRPGNTGFKVWPTRFGNIGVGICWDQWFPECARAMVMQGADILMYPTAIGTEPEDAGLNTKDPWQRAMIGHAVCNAVPVIAANRVGKEPRQSFYGHSFICNHQGEKLVELDQNETGIITSEFDLAKIRNYRAAFGFFRDRRPELYGILTR